MRGGIPGLDSKNIKGEYLNGAYSELAGILGIDFYSLFFLLKIVDCQYEEVRKISA